MKERIHLSIFRWLWFELFSLSEEFFLGISVQELFRVALIPPLGFVSQQQWTEVLLDLPLTTSEFLAFGCIIEHGVPPLWRLQSSSILCSHVIFYLVRFKFKYENFHTLSQVLKRGTEAMNGTYNLVWHFLRSIEVYTFFLALQRCDWYFAFSILVFGPVKRFFLFYWLSMGLKFFVYLDDAFGSHVKRTSATR